jgi:hypothetical protein
VLARVTLVVSGVQGAAWVGLVPVLAFALSGGVLLWFAFGSVRRPDDAISAAG